jgi:hypothetical protein
MPWRKAFDPRHSRAQRAQRAYEVGVFPCSSRTSLMERDTSLVLLRSGYQRLCYNKHKSPL